MAKKPLMISMSAAMGTNREIGRNNELPWHIPEEMKLFRRNTMGKAILMGRNTALSMSGRLKHRLNLVITSHSAPHLGQVTVRSITEAAEFADDELVIIGGGQLYRSALPFAQRLYLTYIDLAVPEADTFFPTLNPEEWFATGREEFAAKPDEMCPAFTFVEWTRITLRDHYTPPEFIPPVRQP